MADKLEAILKINPNAKVEIINGEITNWYETTPISEEDIKAKMTELQAEYDANQYQRDREKEYPSIAEQLDDLYHNGIDGWKATIKITKDKYPKE